MIGTFVTTKFADRAAFDASEPCDVLVAHNRFVLVGLEWMWRLLTGALRNEQGGLSDHLGKGRVIVGDGTRPVEPSDERLAGPNTDWAELDDGYPQLARADTGVTAAFRATFGEDKANFDWLERGVTSVQGVLIDRAVADHGRKAPGTVWTLEATLELTLGAAA